MTSRYFAYGSNLHADEFRRYCAENALDPSVLRPLGRGFLGDHALAFRASAAGEGVADVFPRRGHATAGALFEVSDGFALLDRKEGASAGARRRVKVTVLTDDGSAVEAETYVSASPTFHAAPTPETIALLTAGLVRFRHDPAPVKAAALGRVPACDPTSIFVYGTLRTGEALADVIARHDPLEEGKGVVRGTVRGTLLDLGEYPGLVLEGGPTSRVRGEVFTFLDLEPVLEELDAIEEFHGYGREGSLYRRAIVRVDLDGRERLAWTYVYQGPRNAASVIESGDWIARR